MGYHDAMRDAIIHAADWISNRMFVEPNGRLGVFERYRIDLGERSYWVRPDTTMETARLLYDIQQADIEIDLTRNTDVRQVIENLVYWVVGQQNKDSGSKVEGTFPFYRYFPPNPGPDPGTGELRWENDNGKVALLLLKMALELDKPHWARAASRTLDYFRRVQQQDGSFTRLGPEFVAWPVRALLAGYRYHGRVTDGDAAQKGIRWLLKHQLSDGRAVTTYELSREENWRPPSSETVILLATLADATLTLGTDEYLHSLAKAGAWVVHHQHPTGGILNGDNSCKDASEQEVGLIDLVYTNGYGLEALFLAYNATGERVYLESARRLAQWLCSVQTFGEDPAWDGSWRGSFAPDRQEWAGQADQQNAWNEGGMNSAYVGWATAPIARGLLQLLTYE